WSAQCARRASRAAPGRPFFVRSEYLHNPRPRSCTRQRSRRSALRSKPHPIARPRLRAANGREIPVAPRASRSFSRAEAFRAHPAAPRTSIQFPDLLIPALYLFSRFSGFFQKQRDLDRLRRSARRAQSRLLSGPATLYEIADFSFVSIAGGIDWGLLACGIIPYQSIGRQFQLRAFGPGLERHGKRCVGSKPAALYPYFRPSRINQR